MEKPSPQFVSIKPNHMNIASLGKALANQAIEGTKNTVMAAITDPEPPKPAAPVPETLSAVILGQIQAMQRPLTCEQELAVTVRPGRLWQHSAMWWPLCAGEVLFRDPAEALQEIGNRE